jgi:hypothetical protein
MFSCMHVRPGTNTQCGFTGYNINNNKNKNDIHTLLQVCFPSLKPDFPLVAKPAEKVELSIHLHQISRNQDKSHRGKEVPRQGDAIGISRFLGLHARLQVRGSLSRRRLASSDKQQRPAHSTP